MDTRARIVAEAGTLFAERGYSDTTTAEIARRAGVAEGTIYRHFKSKDDLFVACVEALFGRAARQEAECAEEGTSLREVVRGLLRSGVQMVSDNLDLFDILFSEAPRRPHLLRSAFARAVQVQVEQVGPAFQKFTALRQLRHFSDITEFILGITAAIWAVLRFRGWLGQGSGISEEELTDFLLYGIAGNP